MACSPAMTFHVGKSDIPGRYLLRGDSEGQIVMWTLPEVTERQMTLVRQESFDRLPGKNYFLSKLPYNWKVIPPMNIFNVQVSHFRWFWYFNIYFSFKHLVHITAMQSF